MLMSACGGPLPTAVGVPARIVSLAPSVTEIVYALGAVGHQPRVAVGRGTLQDELIGIAGGENVAADAGDAWPTLALEVVVARAPEVIIDASMGTERGARELFAGLTTVPAVRDGR